MSHILKELTYQKILIRMYILTISNIFENPSTCPWESVRAPKHMVVAECASPSLRQDSPCLTHLTMCVAVGRDCEDGDGSMS